MTFVPTQQKRSRPKQGPARLYAPTALGAGPRPCQGIALDPVPNDATCAVACPFGGLVYDDIGSNTTKAIEAETSACATLRANGTGCRAEALLRRCAGYSKMRTLFEKCASWKIPTIPSKMRTLFQDAHEKLASSNGERCGPEHGLSGEAELSHGWPQTSQACPALTLPANLCILRFPLPDHFHFGAAVHA